MNIKPSKTVRCMSHTNTDTVKRQRESKGAGKGKGQRKFCWPSFKNRWIYLTTWSAPAFCSRNTWSSSRHVATTFHSQNWASYEEPHISALSLALEYIPRWCSSRLQSRDTKVSFFFLCITLRHRENQSTADANTLIISTLSKSSIARRVRLVTLKSILFRCSWTWEKRESERESGKKGRKMKTYD